MTSLYIGLCSVEVWEQTITFMSLFDRTQWSSKYTNDSILNQYILSFYTIFKHEIHESGTEPYRKTTERLQKDYQSFTKVEEYKSIFWFFNIFQFFLSLPKMHNN